MGGSNIPEVYEAIEAELASLAIVNTSPHHKVPIKAPIVSSYDDHIRPLLDTVDKLRSLNLTCEGIQLPTIVVVGDQSSGKSSVLESLAGISLPRGIGICTRVPLIMRLQRSLCPETEIWLEYGDKERVDTDEEHIAEAIRKATDDIAGSGKGVSDTPLTLHVKKEGVPDLTMVDLPGITRVPINGQPENIYEQISKMIMKYIEPQESIILNVLSAQVDFTTCESIHMSRQVDKTGERTLAVVTKADMAPQGLMEKVTADDVNIGLGYVCVRNRVGEETYQEARIQEEKLFKTHPLLSMIEDDIVGIPVLAQKLTQIQATMITRCFPDIVKKINEKMGISELELEKLPKVLTSSLEAGMTFKDIIDSANACLLRILVQGDFSEYPDDQNMHSTCRLADMLSVFSEDLQETSPVNDFELLSDEIKVLEECKSIDLPGFFPRSAFSALHSQHVDGIKTKPVEFIREIFDYVEVVLSSVITKYTENFPQIRSSIKRAGRDLIAKIKEQSVERVIEMIEMEKLAAYTCNPEYVTVYTKNIANQRIFLLNSASMSHLDKYDVKLLMEAFEMNVRIEAYWAIVVRRIVDNIALYIKFSVDSLVNGRFQKEIVAELVNRGGGGGGGDVEKMMMEESPSMAKKREKLENSIKRLKECKETVADI
ncbi:unnamed protein product, partial [Cochlearia groenlandica]